MNEPFQAWEIVSLGGASLNLMHLELIIEILNKNGRVQIVAANTNPGSSTLQIFGPFADEYLKAAIKK